MNVEQKEWFVSLRTEKGDGSPCHRFDRLPGGFVAEAERKVMNRYDSLFRRAMLARSPSPSP
jgi:hypothetical protein